MKGVNENRKKKEGGGGERGRERERDHARCSKVMQEIRKDIL